MSEQIEGENLAGPNVPQRQRRPWSTPRVIVSELRSTYHQVGNTPLDKTNFFTDHMFPSQGTSTGS